MLNSGTRAYARASLKCRVRGSQLQPTGGYVGSPTKERIADKGILRLLDANQVAGVIGVARSWAASKAGSQGDCRLAK
jgi:hypothetical protein